MFINVKVYCDDNTLNKMKMEKIYTLLHTISLDEITACVSAKDQ